MTVLIFGALLFMLVAFVPGVLASEDMAIAQAQVAAPNAPAEFSTSGTINFQGQLSQISGGATVPDGDYKLRFAIYDANSGGNKKWPSGAYEEQTVPIADGLFNVHLGAVESGINAAFSDGGDRYLQVWACSTAGTGCSTFDDLGRLPISTTGYAQSLVPGAVITATNGVGLSIHTNSTSNQTAALYAQAAATTGQTYGVLGITDSYSTTATGVFGWASATSGQTRGVYGLADSTWGVGVFGQATATSGWTYGVVGRSESDYGYGVYGGVSSTNGGASAGVVGNARNGVGVLAESWYGNPFEAYAATSNRLFYISNTGNVYADGTFNSGGADFAEMLPAVEGLGPADVLVINSNGQLALSTEAYQLTVVGVYSTEPGYLGGNADDDDPSGKAPLAVVGIVPVKVSGENGAIQPGNLLVASDTPGHAMRAGENPPNGTVIGKALEAFDGDDGVILLLVILQ